MATKKTSESTKATKQKKTVPAKHPKTASVTEKLSALDAAAKILEQTGQPMTCQELIAAMTSKGLWASPGGRTPANTLSAALRREIHTKGKDARFTLAEPGKFASA